MSTKSKLVPAVLGVAAIAVAGGYFISSQQTPPEIPSEAPTATQQTVATTANPPSAHPVINPGFVNSLALNTDASTQQNPHSASTSATGTSKPALSGQAHQAGNANPDAKFTHFRVGQRNVKRILADGDVMWVGTSGGVIRYNIKTDEYKLYDSRNGLLANGIFYVGKIDNDVAIGTYGGGLSMLNEETGKWRTYNIPEGLGDAFVYDVLKADNGDIWIATWSGANRIRGGDLDDHSKWDLFTVENTNGGLPNDWVYALAMGKNGEIWMATEGGLARFKNDKWDNWNHKDGQGAAYDLVKDQIAFDDDPASASKHHARQKDEMGLEDVSIAYNPNYIIALLVDDNGSVWAGTWGAGLAHFDGESWTNYTVKDGLPGNHIFSLYKNNGKVWIGTEKGLAIRANDGSLQIFNMADGLYADAVFSMATAEDGSAWIGSYGGVARIAKLQ